MSADASTKNGAAHLGSDTFEAALKATTENGKPLFVDFYADWCGPCQLAAPVIEKLASEYADTVTIAKLNVDEARDVAGEQGVMSIPTVIVYKDGKEIDRKIGYPGEQGYRQMLDQVTQS